MNALENSLLLGVNSITKWMIFMRRCAGEDRGILNGGVFGALNTRMRSGDSGGVKAGNESRS